MLSIHLSYEPAASIPKDLWERNDSMCPQKDMHLNFQFLLLIIAKTLEMIQMLIIRKID